MSQRKSLDLPPASFDFTFNLLHQHPPQLPSPSTSVDTTYHWLHHSLRLPTLSMRLHHKRCRRTLRRSAETFTSIGPSQGLSPSIAHPFSLILTSLRTPLSHCLPSLHKHSSRAGHLNGQAARCQPSRSFELRQDQPSAFYVPPSPLPATLSSLPRSRSDRQTRSPSARYHKPEEVSASATSSLLRSQQPQCLSAVPDRPRHWLDFNGARAKSNEKYHSQQQAYGSVCRRLHARCQHFCCQL